MNDKYEEVKKCLESIVDIEKDDGWVVFTYRDHPYRGNFDDLDEYLYIKKQAYVTIRTNDGDTLNQAVLLKFNLQFIDKHFIEKIYNHHIDLVARNKQNTLVEALNETFSYFANTFKEKAKQKILGDIGEAIFILKTKEYTGENIICNIHSTDDGLYDFSFKNQKYIEVKTTSIDKNEIILSNCQIDYVSNRDFIVVKLKKIENATNIVDLYELINEKVGSIAGTVLEDNYYLYKEQHGTLSHFTVNLEKVQIWKLNEKSIPIINIENGSALKKAMFHLDVTDSLEPFEEYIKLQDLS